MKKILFATALVAAMFLTGCKEKEEPVTPPSFEIGVTDELAVPAEGGECEFTYELTNPAVDGNITAGSPEEWIGDFTVASETTVTFPVEANETGAVRSAEVTVRYTYGEGQEIVRTFTAVQDFVSGETPDPEPEPETPEIEVDPAVEIEAAGGPCTIEFKIVNPIEGSELSARYEPQETWIEGFTLNEEAGTVTFTAAPNETQEPRSVLVVLSYVYVSGLDSEDNVVTGEVTVTQKAGEAVEPGYDFEYALTEFYGEYSEYEGSYEFFTYISDRPVSSTGMPEDGSVSYLLDIYSTEAPDDPVNPRPTAGEYYVSWGNESGSFNGSASEVYYDSGTLNISYEGDNIVFELEITDNNGEVHHVTYNGPAPYSGGEEPGGGDDPVVTPGGLGYIYAVAQKFDDELYNYYIYLSDKPIHAEDTFADFEEGSVNYSFQLSSSVPADASNPLPDLTEYSYVFHPVLITMQQNAFYCTSGNFTVSGGSLTLSMDGDKFVIDAVLISDSGEEIQVYYSGAVDFELAN